MKDDRNENKHFYVAKRMIERGGRRDVFLGARECQAYVEPCEFGTGEGAYDDTPEIDYGIMYHGITYADEAYSDDTYDMMTVRMWHCVMKNGIISFDRPEKCIHRSVRKMGIKEFGQNYNNFSGIGEFKEVE